MSQIVANRSQNTDEYERRFAFFVKFDQNKHYNIADEATAQGIYYGSRRAEEYSRDYNSADENKKRGKGRKQRKAEQCNYI